MTKKEVVQIMAILGAFYSGGKNDPAVQAEVWYRILADYDYATAEAAVYHFAKNDTRDYATFPTVGKIVEAIRKQQKRFFAPYTEVIRGIENGRPYSLLGASAKKVISEDKYEEWLDINAEAFIQNEDHYMSMLIKNDGGLLTG